MEITLKKWNTKWFLLFLFMFLGVGVQAQYDENGNVGIQYESMTIAELEKMQIDYYKSTGQWYEGNLQEVVIVAPPKPQPYVAPVYKPIVWTNMNYYVYDSNSGGGSNSGGVVSWSVPVTELTKVKNEIIDPCIKELVSDFINANDNNPFKAYFRSYTFHNNPDWNVRFTQYSDNSTEGIKTVAKMSATNDGTMNIKFNVAALVKASKEYIMATLYHEVVHSQLHMLGTSYSTHHEEMWINYRSNIAKQLKLDFPSLTTEEAAALAMEGLYETPQWESLKARDINDGTTRTNDIYLINNNFQNESSYGTHCNK